MKRNIGTGLVLAAFCAGTSFAQTPPAKPPVTPPPSDTLPMVPPAKPGVFTAQKKGATGYILCAAGRTVTKKPTPGFARRP